MAGTAFVLGGTGQIGIAVARTLANAGWDVAACDRGSRAAIPVLTQLGVERHVADRRNPGELEAALGAGADVRRLPLEPLRLRGRGPHAGRALRGANCGVVLALSADGC